MAAARAHQAEEPPRKVRRLEPLPKKAATAAVRAAAVAATTAAAATAQIHVFKERPPLPRPFGWVPPKLVDNQQAGPAAAGCVIGCEGNIRPS